MGPDDAVLSDELNHASIIDGVRLCKAKKFKYKNKDLAGNVCEEHYLICSAHKRLTPASQTGVYGAFLYRLAFGPN